ncbi:hypothetical protein LY76DRAFT_592714 [Colletotrichum caudatum]|nr:hypothetical protein LY76DRAFT_592714 [Colletotrichum caudatum]
MSVWLSVCLPLLSAVCGLLITLSGYRRRVSGVRCPQLLSVSSSCCRGFQGLAMGGVWRQVLGTSLRECRASRYSRLY